MGRPEGKRRWMVGAAVIVASALALCGCTSPAPTTTPGSPPVFSTPTPTLSGDISPHAIGTTLPFECANPIGTGPTSEALAGPTAPGVPGIMAISTPDSGSGIVQVGDGSSYRGLQFAKVGLVLKAGIEFSLSVPPDMAGRMKIGWSNSGSTLADTLTIPGCTSAQARAAWLVYPGGFWLEEAGCVPLVVTSGGSSTTIHIPVGMPCP